MTIDYKRILFNALRYWYIVILSFVIGIGIAYLTNRYSTRIYPVTSSIIIREYAENADAKFLYNNPLVNSYRNYFNEPYIIRSYPLITQVVEDLNFHVTVVKQGEIKGTEQYNSLPFRVKLKNKQRPTTLRLEYTGENKFICSTSDGDKVNEFRVGDSVECQGVKFIVEQNGDMSKLKGGQYMVQFRNPVDVASGYIGKLKVTWALPGSSVVNLDINGAIPQKEIDFLNKLIEYYQRYDLEKKNLAASRSLLFIDDQLKRTGDSLRSIESTLESFKRMNFVTDIEAEAKELYDQLQVLSEQRAVVVYSENYYNYLDEYLKTGKAREQVILPSSVGIVDPVLSTMVDKMTEVQRELDALTNFGANNPMVSDRGIVLMSSFKELKAQILEAVNTVRATDKIKIRGLDKQIDQIEVALRRLPGAERKLVNIQRNFELNENLFIFLQQKRAEAGISKASTTTDIQMVNPPRMAGGAITPKVQQNYLTWGGAGILLPLLIFIALELFNNKIQSKEDIEKLTTIPFIGAIGHNDSGTSLVVFEKPKSALAEAFRAIRSNLNYFTEGKDKRVFMVTSSLSGEGKTFTTINLATIFALAGKKTIIIGADLRRPKIFQDFGLGNEKGLSVYLSGMATEQEVIQHTQIDNLDLISGGPIPPNPSELIINHRMDELMKSLHEKYDFILVDTPPMTVITDSMVLAKYADYTIYILRQNYTPREVVRVADEVYAAGKIKNMSLVLNDVYRTGPGYGSGQYGYGYGYGYGYYYGNPKRKDGGYYQD